MATALQICRICLGVNIKMFTFKNTNMEHLYQLLTQVYVDIDDGKPATVCYLCHARLQQCDRLKQQAIKSNELLEQLLGGGFMQATANAIINNQYTSQDLQASTTYHLDLEPTTCEEGLLEPKVECNNLLSVKEETEAIDEERKNVPLILDFFEDGYDPYGFTQTKNSTNCDSKEDKQITVITSNHCDGIKDVGQGLEQRKHQDEDFSEDAYDPNGFASKAVISDTEDDQPLKIIGSNKCHGVKDTANDLEQSKQQEKEYWYQVPSEKEIKSNPLAFSLNRRLDVIETQVGINSKESQENSKTDIIMPKPATFQSSTTKAPLKIHSGEKSFSCDVCGYKCAHNSVFIRHIRTHTGEKPFSCNICEYRCAREFSLKTHMKKHLTKTSSKQHLSTDTGEKPHSCIICEYRCAHRRNLIMHMRTHTGEKPFSCDICGYECAIKYNLTNHMRKHTGEKPFSCNMCEYRCKDKPSLKSHLSRKHK